MNESPEGSPRQHLWALAAMVCGVGLIGLSLVWPSVSSGRSQWSDEQAKQYQKTSAEYHSLSHEVAHQAEQGGDLTALTEQFNATQAEFERLHAQLQAARNSPARMAGVLRLMGVVLVAVGAVLHYGPRLRGGA